MRWGATMTNWAIWSKEHHTEKKPDLDPAAHFILSYIRYIAHSSTGLNAISPSECLEIMLLYIEGNDDFNQFLKENIIKLHAKKLKEGYKGIQGQAEKISKKEFNRISIAEEIEKLSPKELHDVLRQAGFEQFEDERFLVNTPVVENDKTLSAEDEGLLD